MQSRINLISLILAAGTSGVFEILQYLYLDPVKFIFISIAIATILATWIVGSFISVKGFLLSLLLIPLIALNVVSQSGSASLNVEVSTTIFLLITLCMSFLTWTVAVTGKFQSNKKGKKINSSNLKIEIYQILKELEYLETP